ncbi:rRNA-processing protein CGR1 [Trypanosoma conorhini]|uniref:rRNA-processing protein CGR1 n=1 Tax=Trypanosoma conorhini TaxID=83891 RepID=A0A3R7NJ97_9TRYP|nr:rRNA-processing protein CGR1 [Trypanosoma conorhini]RNF19235.1 rRNA-processing protein CGR1 [Trypanosoma conorhini]
MGGLEQRRLKKEPRRPQRTTSKGKWTKAPQNVEKKLKKQEDVRRLRELSKKLRDDLNNEEKRVREARKANMERRKENEKKNMVVQKIKNDKAIRKLSPKHRKKARIFMLHEL